MKVFYSVIFFLILTQACNSQPQEQINYRIFGYCDGCEAVLEFGDRTLSAIDTLPDFEEYDPKMKLSGTIYKPDGKTPASDVVLFIYHTNPEGKYPKRGDETGLAKKQGYIRGWVKTDAEGKYTFYTFLPGSYSSNESHIHAVILEPDGKYYFIDDYNFEGDPNFNTSYKRKNRGGSGIVELHKKDQLLIGKRDIILGLNIKDYE
ncbi:MAG: intradiol ring-cleavage dioxygenase [Candidatus Cyclobacteriaceae bacterium M2_1C_046]